MSTFHYDTTKKTLEIKPHDQADGTLDASVILELQSIDKGFLIPKMTVAQRDAITLPAKGLAVFNTTANRSEENIGTPGAPVWASAAGVRTPIEVLFGAGTTPMFSTSSTSYVQVGVFRFGGTISLGTPAKIKVVGFKDATTTSWDVRIFDLTSSLVIAEKTGNTGTAAEIVDLGALSNLPTGEAMFEVQLKRAGGPGGSEVHSHAVSVEF